MIGKQVLNLLYSTNLENSIIICLDSEKLFSEPNAISLKPQNEACDGEKWSEQPTSAFNAMHFCLQRRSNWFVSCGQLLSLWRFEKSSPFWLSKSKKFDR